MASSSDPSAAARTDHVLTTHHRSTSTRGDATVGSADRISAAARIHLLAVRVFWGAAHPSYPSTQRVRHDLDATAAYYDRISRGHQVMHAQLTRWIHVRSDSDTMCNHLRTAARLTTDALTRAGFQPGRYNRLMLFTEQCNAAVSAAQQPGRLSWIRYRNPGSATLIHELGHNLGLGHANGLVCSQQRRRVTISGSCTSVEYGDSWDAMGHSRASFSVPVLERLGWAGNVATATTSGSYRIADVERSGDHLQGVRIVAGHHTTYWVEYQPEHLAEVGRTTSGVIIRRQVGQGPVEILDAAPGNPTGIAFPDADLTNAALPVGSSFTTPENIRISTVAAGRLATVGVAFNQSAARPAAPSVDYAARLGDGRYRVRWERPDDNGQIVLGYRVTSVDTGASVYLRSTGGGRTSVVLPADAAGGDGDPAFTVEALNQLGWSAASDVEGRAFGPQVTVTSPQRDAHVRAGFEVSLTATPDGVTAAPPVKAWADVDGVSCTGAEGAGPYTLDCDTVTTRHATVTVHVENTFGAVTDVSVPVRLKGPIRAPSSGTDAAAGR